MESSRTISPKDRRTPPELDPPITFSPLPEVTTLPPPSAERASQLCRVARMVLGNLDKSGLEHSPLTLQQLLLNELLDLEGCEDEELILHTLTALLSADRTESPSFVSLRKYPPFARDSEASRRYQWILALAGNKEIITAPLSTLYADSPQEWEQHPLSEEAVQQLTTLYQRLFERFTRGLKLPTACDSTTSIAGGKGLGLQQKVERCNHSVQERAEAPHHLLNCIVADPKLAYRLDEVARSISRYAQTVLRMWESLRNHTRGTALLPYGARDLSHALRGLEQYAPEDRYKLFTQFMNESPILDTLLGRHSLKREEKGNRSYTLYEIATELTESVEELSAWLPFRIDRDSLMQIAQDSARQTGQGSRRKRVAKKVQRFDPAGQSVQHIPPADQLWRITGQRMRFVLRSLPELARHIQTLQQKSPQPIAMDEELPAWIAALDDSPKPKQKKAKHPPSSAESLESIPSSWEWIEKEEEVKVATAPTSSPTPNELDQLLTAPCSLELLPKVGLLLENQLKKSSKVPLEGILLREASHHLFLLHQGMQLLFSGIQRGDRDAVTVAFPLLILDHHTFMESLLKSRMAAATHALSQEHSLCKLGGESPYLQSCNRGDLWERYLHTSRAYHEAHKRELPEALRLVLAIDQGKYNPAELVAFALQTYRELLEEWQPLTQEERLRLITWIESVAPREPYSMKRKKEKCIEAEGIINRLPPTSDWQDSPAIPAHEAISHWRRLQAARRLVRKEFHPAQSAYFHRTMQTAHYLFEQCYGARIFAQCGRSPMGHDLKTMQDELDPDAGSNSEVLLYQVGIDRRYPEYGEDKPSLRLLRDSRRWVGVEEGFTPANRAQSALQEATTLSSKIQKCCQVAEEQLRLLANDLRLFGVREKEISFS